ncbi:MAG: hypothetical protein FGM27_01695 [Candidatus Omnitrophica bacterium]|nr:hypothetical protein [Candidatus Omnitrophota bacterium]
MEFPGRIWECCQSVALAVSLAAVSAGCASSAKNVEPAASAALKAAEEQSATLQALSDEVARLNQELETLYTSREGLLKAQSELEDQLQGPVAAGDASVSMQPRGLVVTVLDRVLFDSGKAELKETSQSTLRTVAQVLNDQVKENKIFVEGHTDNVPIRVSRWRSNWELSAARSAEVVHFFIDVMGLDPRRAAVVGYGEFHPIADNSTPSGRQKNRRVEIVISPDKWI